MVRESGPIARMLFEHELTVKLAQKIESSMIEYIQNDDSNKLMENIQNYINHVSSHLMKENLRLFVMADTLLSSQSHNINNALEKIENDKLEKIGKQRKYYEGLANNMESKLKNL
jgi:hemerythrin-like domain-containing protein